MGWVWGWGCLASASGGLGTPGPCAGMPGQGQGQEVRVTEVRVTARAGATEGGRVVTPTLAGMPEDGGGPRGMSSSAVMASANSMATW